MRGKTCSSHRHLWRTTCMSLTDMIRVLSLTCTSRRLSSRKTLGKRRGTHGASRCACRQSRSRSSWSTMHFTPPCESTITTTKDIGWRHRSPRHFRTDWWHQRTWPVPFSHLPSDLSHAHSHTSLQLARKPVVVPRSVVDAFSWSMWFCHVRRSDCHRLDQQARWSANQVTQAATSEVELASNQAQPLLIWWRRDQIPSSPYQQGLGLVRG